MNIARIFISSCHLRIQSWKWRVSLKRKILYCSIYISHSSNYDGLDIFFGSWIFWANWTHGIYWTSIRFTFHIWIRLSGSLQFQNLYYTTATLIQLHVGVAIFAEIGDLYKGRQLPFIKINSFHIFFYIHWL